MVNMFNASSLKSIQMLLDDVISSQMDLYQQQVISGKDRVALHSSVANSQVPAWISTIQGLMDNPTLLPVFQKKYPWWTTAQLQSTITNLQAIKSAATPFSLGTATSTDVANLNTALDTYSQQIGTTPDINYTSPVITTNPAIQPTYCCIPEMQVTIDSNGPSDAFSVAFHSSVFLKATAYLNVKIYVGSREYTPLIGSSIGGCSVDQTMTINLTGPITGMPQGKNVVSIYGSSGSKGNGYYVGNLRNIIAHRIA